MKKLLTLAGLLSLTAGLALAGNFTHVISSNDSYSGSVSVPSAASCYQFAAAYTYSPYNPSITINSGPLGYYYMTNTSSPNYISVSGSISAGTYSIYQSQIGSGYSGVTINW